MVRLTWNLPRINAAWRAEACGAAAALVLGLLVIAHLSATARAWVLFYDGDSLLFPLVTASLHTGQAQHWALTSPLFLLEAVAYLLVGAVGLPVQTTLILDGLLNWAAFYAVTRAIASNLSVRREARITVSAASVALFSVLALCESSASHDALEPASLLATTTYYSGTVIAVLGAIALAVRTLRTPRFIRASTALGAVAAIATTSNPLFIAWGVVPLLLVSALTLVAGSRLRSVFATAAAMIVGSGLGLLARIPFQPILVQDSTTKIRPDLAQASGTYYASLLNDRLHTSGGVIECIILLILLVCAGAALVLAIRQRRIVDTVLAGVALLGPVLVLAGSITLGTFAARYLEPVVFLPPLVLLTAPNLFPKLAHRSARARANRSARFGAAVLGLTLAVTSISSLAATASRPTPSIACAARWVTTHNEYGAGEYWTIRAIKAYSPDPRRLIQTDANAAPYVWLSNAADLDQQTITYSITSNASDPLGTGFPTPRQVTTCGTYTINVYATPVHLGTPHH